MSLELLSWVLVIETGIVGLVALYLISFVLGKQKKKQREAVTSITKAFQKNCSKRTDNIVADTAFSSIDEQLLDEFLQEIDQKEALLYQQITKVFLQKDISDFKSCDKRVEEVSSSYWKLLRQLVLNSNGGVNSNDELVEIKAELDVAMSEQERLGEQLNEVLSTLDEVSNEYTHLFSSSKDQDELNTSKGRMMEYFEKARKAKGAS